MKFSYIAIGQDRKKQSGRLEAGSLALAKKQLHQLNLSIVTLNEIEKSSDQPNFPHKTPSLPIITYYFEAKNAQGKKLDGTIDAHDAYIAYKRLITDHQLDVLDLHVYEPKGGNPRSLKPNFGKWQGQLKQENLSLAKTAKPESPTTPVKENSIDKEKNIPPKTQTLSEESASKATAIQEESMKKAASAQETRQSTAFKLSQINFSAFFLELNSFIGWLLFFYITYFFLASFSLERNIGFSQEFVTKTLGSPLIINIFIFLLIAHLTLKLKIRLFQGNVLGSMFLFFLSLGTYTLLVTNF